MNGREAYVPRPGGAPEIGEAERRVSSRPRDARNAARWKSLPREKRFERFDSRARRKIEKGDGDDVGPRVPEVCRRSIVRMRATTRFGRRI